MSSNFIILQGDSATVPVEITGQTGTRPRLAFGPGAGSRQLTSRILVWKQGYQMPSVNAQTHQCKIRLDRLPGFPTYRSLLSGSSAEADKVMYHVVVSTLENDSIAQSFSMGALRLQKAGGVNLCCRLSSSAFWVRSYAEPIAFGRSWEAIGYTQPTAGRRIQSVGLAQCLQRKRGTPDATTSLPTVQLTPSKWQSFGISVFDENDFCQDPSGRFWRIVPRNRCGALNIDTLHNINFNLKVEKKTKRTGAVCTRSSGCVYYDGEIQE